MANCKNCGAEISPLAKVCPYCGMPQQVQEEDPFDQTQAYIPNQGQPSGGNYNSQPAGNGYGNQSAGGYNNQPVSNYNNQVTLVKTININNAMTYAEQQARYASAKKWGIASIVIGIALSVLVFIGQMAQAGVF